jgi:hypothetical protein
MFCSSAFHTACSKVVVVVVVVGGGGGGVVIVVVAAVVVVAVVVAVAVVAVAVVDVAVVDVVVVAVAIVVVAVVVVVVRTLRFHVSILPTTIAYDPGLLSVLPGMPSLPTIIANYLGYRILTSTVVLITGRSESGFETPI